jgi:hypothetical protein
MMEPSDLAVPRNYGIRAALENSFEQYLLLDSPNLRGFILSQFDNYYMYYFATRLINGRGLIRDMYPEGDRFMSEHVMQIAAKICEMDCASIVWITWMLLCAILHRKTASSNVHCPLTMLRLVVTQLSSICREFRPMSVSQRSCFDFTANLMTASISYSFKPRPVWKQ